MIQIIVEPTFDDNVVCKNCNAEYIFRFSDIQYDEVDTLEGSYITRNYVRCPVCSQIHIIKFNKDDKKSDVQKVQN